MAALTSGYLSPVSLQWPWIIFFRSNFEICRILLLGFYADNLKPHEYPSCLPGDPSTIPIWPQGHCPLPHLVTHSLQSWHAAVLYIVLSWILWHSAWPKSFKMRGYGCLLKLESSKRQNPFSFETIGNVVLSSCFFLEKLWGGSFSSPHCHPGCCSLAWSNWANEIPSL